MNALRSSTVALLSLLMTFAIACSGGSGEGGSDDAPARVFLSIGTAPVVGGFYLMGGAIGEVMNANPADINWQVTAEATKGSQENIRRLGKGEIELALSNAAITYHAVRGEASWGTAQNVKAVMTLAQNVAQFITTDSSGISSIADLAGKRVAVGPAGAGFEQFVGPLLAAHGMSYDDIVEVNATQGAAVDMLKDGSVAAAFLGGAVPHPAIIQASASLDVLFIPFDEAAREKLVEDYAFFDKVTVPAGTYQNSEEDFAGLNVGNMHLITSSDQDEDLVYQVTRAIYENRAAVVERAAAGRAINPENVARDTGTEFHPGAIRYYEEIGVWPAQ